MLSCGEIVADGQDDELIRIIGSGGPALRWTVLGSVVTGFWAFVTGDEKGSLDPQVIIDN